MSTMKCSPDYPFKILFTHRTNPAPTSSCQTTHIFTICSRPPYYDCPAQTSDLKRQCRRYFCGRLGRPASSDVAILATIISDLTHQTNAFLQSSGLGELEIAFITAPDLPALYAEDLADAAEYTKMQMLTLPGAIFKSPGGDGAWVVSEVNTACAGNGLGLSYLHDGPYTKSLSMNNSPIDDKRPHFEFENERMSKDELKVAGSPWPWNISALSVLFTKTAFSVHQGYFSIASATSSPMGCRILNFSLGLSQSSSSFETTTNESIYWHEIRQAIRTVLKSWYGLPYEVSRAIIYGESVRDEDLNAIIREEIQRVRDGDEVERQSTIFYSEDPVYAAARGAALLADWCSKLKDYYSCFPDLRPRMRDWF